MSSAATAPVGDPRMASNVAPPSAVRNTPSDVTSTGSRYGGPKTATGDPAGAAAAAVQRAPPSRESLSPADDARRSTVFPAGSRNAVREPAGGRGSTETRRTDVPSAAQTPLSSPPYARKK